MGGVVCVIGMSFPPRSDAAEGRGAIPGGRSPDTLNIQAPVSLGLAPNSAESRSAVNLQLRAVVHQLGLGQGGFPSAGARIWVSASTTRLSGRATLEEQLFENAVNEIVE